jgi:hypothetical protein
MAYHTQAFCVSAAQSSAVTCSAHRSRVPSQVHSQGGHSVPAGQSGQAQVHTVPSSGGTSVGGSVASQRQSQAGHSAAPGSHSGQAQVQVP